MFGSGWQQESCHLYRFMKLQTPPLYFRLGQPDHSNLANIFMMVQLLAWGELNE